MTKLVLIDGNAILHRAYHALPPLTTKRGEPINAVYGLTSMLLRVIQDLKPTHIAVAFDRKEPTFRHKEFAGYQAQRPPMDKDLSSQFQKAKDVLTAMTIPIYEMAGFEADDVIGTIALQSTQNPKVDEVVIVTGDRDILQLVDDKKGVRVYLPIKGLSEAKLMGESEVVEKMGVEPKKIVDYKALVGDQSDNYSGVAGIGPKTAIKILDEYGTLDNIYNNLKKINPALREKLEKGKENAHLSLRLARIVTDVDLGDDLEKAKMWRVDSQKLLNLFADFGFKTLTKRVKKVGKQIVSENQTNLF